MLNSPSTWAVERSSRGAKALRLRLRRLGCSKKVSGVVCEFGPPSMETTLMDVELPNGLYLRIEVRPAVDGFNGSPVLVIG